MKKMELPRKVAHNSVVELCGPLQVELLPSGLKVRLVKDYRVRVKSSSRFYHSIHPTVSVPKGFETDFASVPRLLWQVLPPWGRYSPAAVVHDYLYVNRKSMFSGNRKKVDKIFCYLMKKFGVPWWKRRIMYLGVRIGGWVAWRRHGQ